MPYNPVQETSLLTNEQMGLPNYGEAIKQGMLGAQRSMQTAIKPKELAEKLLAYHLENKQRQILNQFLPQSESLRMASMGLRNSIMGNDLAESNYKTNLMKSLFGGGPDNAAAQNSYGQNDITQSPSEQNPSGDNYIDQYGQILPSEEAYNQASNAAPETEDNFNAQSRAQHGNQNQIAGLDINKIKSNPALAAAAKSLLGFDVTAETPQEKVDRQIETYNAKLTNAQKTQHQNVVNNTIKLSRKINELIEAPSPTELPFYRPNSRAVHSSLVKSASETYAKAKGWPNTNESIRAAQSILDRHTAEGDDSYRERLKNEMKDLVLDAGISEKILQTGKTEFNPSQSQIKQAPNSGLVLMVDPHTNKIYKVKEQDVPKYIAQGAHKYEK